MSRYTTINYCKRTPQARVQRILTNAPAVSPTPPPLVTYYLISGTVTENGSAPGFVTAIEFPSVGTIFTAVSGSYGVYVHEGYGGTAVPHSALGEFVPQVRVYGSVGMDTPNQDYAYTAYVFPDVVISGEVRLDGAVLDGARVNFSGSGSALSDASGTYAGSVAYSYSGAGSVSGFGAPNYAVTPSARTYTNITTDQAGQDYDITTQIFLISGTTSTDSGPFSASLSNGTTLWSSAANGSYGFNVVGGWSGSTDPVFLSNPSTYNYVSVTADMVFDDYYIPTPPLAYSYPNLTWTWPVSIPDTWSVQVQNPDDLTWSQLDLISGAALSYPTTTSYGTYYRIVGFDPGLSAITPPSNAVLVTEPLDITGEIRLDGVPISSVLVSFTSDGQVSSNVSGTYTNTLVTGYSGTASVLGYSLPGYAVSPAVRIYPYLATNQAGQDYDITTQVYVIEGTTTSDGSGYSTEITNGSSTWNTSASGSYSYLVVGGWSGTTTTTYISDPDSYVYSNVTADFTSQDFDIPVPPLFYAPTSLSWGGWAYTDPAFWFVEVSATGSTAWTHYDYTAGTVVSENVVDSVGSYFRISGVDSGSSAITPLSAVVYATPPDPGAFTISGALTDMGSPMVGIGVEVETYGTVITNGSGTYSQEVIGGFTGNVIPHYTGGTFDPDLRSYVNLTSDQFNQDFVFYGTSGGTIIITGALTSAGAPLPQGVGVEVTSYGTTITDVDGTYSQSVVSGYSGTVIPHYVSGTFDPQVRIYSTVVVDQTNQDFVFYGTASDFVFLNSEVLSGIDNGYPSISVAFSGSLIYVLDGNDDVWVSADGYNYTLVGNAGGSAFVFTYGGIFVSAGLGGAVSTSADAITWTPRTSNTTEWLYGITYASEISTYVAVGDAGAVTASTDATSWTATSVGASNLTWVTWGAGPAMFVAVGDSNGIFTSPDGFSWTQRTSPSTTDYRAVTYDNTSGLFAAVGTSGIIVTSSDGTTWTERAAVPGLDFYGVAWGNNRYAAVSYEKTIYVSSDGTTWSPNTGDTYNFVDIAVFYYLEIDKFMVLQQSPPT